MGRLLMVLSTNKLFPYRKTAVLTPDFPFEASSCCVLRTCSNLYNETNMQVSPPPAVLPGLLSTAIQAVEALVLSVIRTSLSN